MKVLIVEFLEREDNLFEQTLEWLSSNLKVTVKPRKNAFTKGLEHLSFEIKL